MSINEQRGKENVVYQYSELLFSHKNEVLIHAIWKHDGKWNKLAIKPHIFYDSTGMISPEIYKDKK